MEPFIYLVIVFAVLKFESSLATSTISGIIFCLCLKYFCLSLLVMWPFVLFLHASEKPNRESNLIINGPCTVCSVSDDILRF